MIGDVEYQFREWLSVLILRLAQQSVETDPPPPVQCPTCRAEAWHKWSRPNISKIVDPNATNIATQQYRCKNCGKTVTAWSGHHLHSLMDLFDP